MNPRLSCKICCINDADKSEVWFSHFDEDNIPYFTTDSSKASMSYNETDIMCLMDKLKYYLHVMVII